MDAETLAGMLTLQFRYTAGTLDMNLAGVSDADALRTVAPAGNCVAWVMGHLVNARIGMLGMLGVASPVATEPYERFARSSAAVAADEDVPTLTRLRADYTATQEPLLNGLAKLTDEAAAAPAPISLAKRKNETLGTLLVGLAFHECYHAGQVGMLRRHLGLPGAIV